MSTNGTDPELQFSSAEVPAEPLTFTIDGESFTVRSWMTGSQFVRYSKQMVEGGLTSAIMVGDFFANSMEPEEYTRFLAFIEDPNRHITVEVLGKIFETLFQRQTTASGVRPVPTEPSTP